MVEAKDDPAEETRACSFSSAPALARQVDKVRTDERGKWDSFDDVGMVPLAD